MFTNWPLLVLMTAFRFVLKAQRLQLCISWTLQQLFVPLADWVADFSAVADE